MPIRHMFSCVAYVTFFNIFKRLQENTEAKGDSGLNKLRCYRLNNYLPFDISYLHIKNLKTDENMRNIFFETTLFCAQKKSGTFVVKKSLRKIFHSSVKNLTC